MIAAGPLQVLGQQGEAEGVTPPAFSPLQEKVVVEPDVQGYPVDGEK